MVWYYTTALFTCLSAKPGNTTGAQLLWIQSYVDNHVLRKPSWWLFNKILTKNFGTKDWEKAVFEEYYPLDHPVNKVWYDTVGAEVEVSSVRH